MTGETVLIVDDSNFDRTMLQKKLLAKGYRVVELPSAENFFETIEKEKPDVVLMDIMMPKISGQELLKTLREKYSAIQLPVLMVTGRCEISDITESLHSGANDYITKPNDIEVLHTRIQTHLKISKLSVEMAQLKEAEALTAMTITYNHEINNPLAIAISHLALIQDTYPEDLRLKRIEESLWRISDIVKKISRATDKAQVQYQEYVNSTKMIKVK